MGLLQVVFEVLRVHLREMFEREDESTGEKLGLVIRVTSQSLKSLATDVLGLGWIIHQSVHCHTRRLGPEKVLVLKCNERRQHTPGKSL